LLESGVITDPKQRDESIRHIRATIRAALALIDDLAELARAESGRLTVNLAPMSTLAFLRRTLDEFRAQAVATGHELVDELPSHLPGLTTDAARVRQVLGNLLSNALKHTPRGSIVRLRASVRRGQRDDDAGEWVTVSVSDTGPGIPETEQRQLFHEFVRLKPDAAPGSGLGLAISQQVARRLGGKITLESRPGVGSTFTLWLPRQQPRASSAA
jgi:signal transduction histidine kinase